MNEIRNFGTPDFILARQTIDVGARAADPPSFDDGRSFSRSCQMPGEVFSALATSDDDILIIFSTHIEVLSSGIERARGEALHSDVPACAANVSTAAVCTINSRVGLTYTIGSPDQFKTCSASQSCLCYGLDVVFEIPFSSPMPICRGYLMPFTTSSVDATAWARKRKLIRAAA